MRVLRIAIVIAALLMLSASASASEMLYQLGSVLSGFPAMTVDNNPVAINNNIFHAFTEPQAGSGAISVSPVKSNNLVGIFSSMPRMLPMFSNLASQESSNPASPFTSGIAANNPLTVSTPVTDMSAISPVTSNTKGINDLYTASSPDEEYVYRDQSTVAMHPSGNTAKALKIVSTTDLYKEYTKYPHTPWRYIDLGSSAYPAGTVDITTEINPKIPSGPSTVNEWYNPDAPASGELFFCVDLNTGKILSQNFMDYRDAL